MNPEEKYRLITRNLQEVVGDDQLKELLKKRDLKVYWGTAPTGKPHIGYFVAFFKIRDFLNSGCHVTILLADIHAFLDNMKSTWEQLEYRTKYYEFITKEMLKAIGADIKKLKFVQGSKYQFKEKYTLDVYRMAALTTTRDTKRAGAEVVKQMETPKMSSLLYPILQAVDEEYLEVDAQFGGVDQRKIFMLAREFLPRIGYKKRIHLMNPMIGGLSGEKMSSSEESSKVDALDDEKTVTQKLSKAFCPEGATENNFFTDFARIVIFPHLSDLGKEFVISRPDKFGGSINYSSFKELEKDFSEKKLHPQDLKTGVAAYINSLLEPIRKAAQKTDVKEWLAKGY